MKHRHIDTQPGQWAPVLVHSIWERGTDADIKALIRQVKINPQAAEAVRKAIPHSTVYGYPRFFKLYLEKLDGKK